MTSATPVGDKDNAMQILRWLNHAEAVEEVPAQLPCHMLSPQASETMCLHSNRPRTVAAAGGATQEVQTPMPRKRTPRKHRILRTHGQRIAWTNTSPIPDDTLLDALRFLAKEVNLDGVVVHAKTMGDRRSYGRAYSVIPLIASLAGLREWEWEYLIVVTDGRGDGWFETLAHEAKHIEQFREGLRCSEVACRAFQVWARHKWEAAPR